MSARSYLDSLVLFGQKLGLDATRQLCRALDHPENACPSLLVAGTNGKGSVAAYLDSALRENGLRAGRYTSPHLVRVNERITVDGVPISDQELEHDIDRIRGAAHELQVGGALSGPPTYFEALTVAAFLRFREAGVDVAVLEVGMGGRLDATNVVEPLVSAIVSIDFDHQAYLGSTLDAIAREKAGVMRAGRATVVGALPAEARRALEEEALTKGARLVDATADLRWQDEDGAIVLTSPTADYRGLRPLPGRHQRDNLAVAVRVLEEAKGAGVALDALPTARGLSRTQWPGRLQWIPGEIPLLLDGAHNVAGARALADYLKGVGPFVLVFGVLRDKDYQDMARILFPLARAVVVTRPPSGRAADVDEIRRAAPRGTELHDAPDTEAALRKARALAHGVGPVVVAGSLFLVGAVLAHLERRDF